MRAYRDSITLELDEIEQRVLANFYNMVRDGILEDFPDDDVLRLLNIISYKKTKLPMYDEEPDIKIVYTEETQTEK